MTGCGKRVGLGPGIRGMGRCGTTVIMGSVFVCETCRAKAARAERKAAKEARKPKPAPVVAAEGRTLLVVECERMPGALDEESYFLDAFFDTVDAEQRLRQLTEDYDEAEGSEDGRPTLTRWVHEAAIAVAREEGRREERERVFADLRDRFVLERDDAAIDAKERGEPDYVKGITWAIDVLDRAAKGAAK